MAKDDWLGFFLGAGLPTKAASSYAAKFAAHRIQPNMVADLDKEILQAMGIEAMGDVIAILRAAKKPKTEDSLTVETGSPGRGRSTPASRIVDRYLGKNPDAVPMNISTPAPFKHVTNHALGAGGGGASPSSLRLSSGQLNASSSSGRISSGGVFQRLGDGVGSRASSNSSLNTSSSTPRILITNSNGSRLITTRVENQSLIDDDDDGDDRDDEDDSDFSDSDEMNSQSFKKGNDDVFQRLGGDSTSSARKKAVALALTLTPTRKAPQKPLQQSHDALPYAGVLKSQPVESKEPKLNLQVSFNADADAESSAVSSSSSSSTLQSDFERGKVSAKKRLGKMRGSDSRPKQSVTKNFDDDDGDDDDDSDGDDESDGDDDSGQVASDNEMQVQDDDHDVPPPL